MTGPWMWRDGAESYSYSQWVMTLFYPNKQTNKKSTGRTARGSIALREQRHLVCCSVCGKSADRSSKKHSLAQERHLYVPCRWDQVSGIYRLHNRDQNRKQLQKFDNNSFFKERKKYEMQFSHVVTVAETWVTLDLQDKRGSSILSGGLVGKWEENYF